jgi:hypothetical protein
MKTQFENRVMSSFLLWVDHTLLDKGEAYTNHGSNFYNVDALYYNYQTYGAPFKQFVTDTSITDATVMSGVYIGGNSPSNFKKTGQSPLVDINFEQGQVYFSSTESSTISGNYSVKDFNVYLTAKAEQELLFENKIDLRPNTAQTITGLASETSTYPAIFIKNNGGTNDPFAFGGMDKTKIEARAIVLSDSQFKLDAACAIFKDQARTRVPVISDENYPFNALGGLKTGVYNYEALTKDIGYDSEVFISNVDVSRFSLGYMENLKNTNPDVFKAIVDFELETMRYPREG